MADLKADIEKYLSGKLSPAEMHALEKRALDDPFLAEALEGGSLVSPDEFMSDVKDLQKAIEEKTIKRESTQSTFWKWPLRIAAGLLLLAGSTYIVINLVGEEKNETNTIALNKSIEEPQASSVPRESDSVLAESNLSTSESAQPSAAERGDQTEKRIASESEQKPKDAIHAEEESDDLIIADEVDEISEAKVPVEEESIVVSPPQETIAQTEDLSRAKSRATDKESRQELRDVAVSAPSGAAAPSKMIIDSKLIKGKVTDIDDGLPLPGVNVLVEGTTIGTVTDLNGNYEIDVPEHQNNLVFSYIGMVSKEVIVDENKKESAEVDVQLTPDVSELSEVVVTGYGTGEEPPAMEDIKWEITEPEGGKKVYRNYLQQNLHYPEVAIKNNVEGKVTVQFTVEPSGQLTDFRVVKSLGSGCDDEVIRLIKEGPKWRPTRRNDEPVKSKAKVKMRFNLPGKKKD